MERWAGTVTHGPVLDVACGGGRHSAFFRDRGFQVIAVDKATVRLEGIRFVEADLEGGPWPFPNERFGAIVVTNYLHRPLFPHLLDALDEAGVLIYETFMVGNERYGRPSNPDFLLKPGELLQAFKDLQVLGFEEGFLERPKPSVTQRICAARTSKR